MRETFEKALPKILKYEGGYSNHPLDKGGPTNLGITLSTVQHFYEDYDYGDLDGDGDIDIDDIKLLDTPEEAAPIYKKYYWDKMRLDEFPAGIDFLMFDFGVNSGPKNAIKILQRALNMQSYGLEVDGLLGARTLFCTNSCVRDTLILYMIIQREDFYNRIVTNNPSQQVFYNGWMNRLRRVSQEVWELT